MWHRKVTGMGVDATTTPSSSGLTTVVDTIAAPKAAFERLREAPTWGWAFLIAIVLMTIGYFMQKQAADHASMLMIQHVTANNPALTDAQKAKMIANAAHPPAYNAIIGIAGLGLTIFIAVFFNTLITLIGNAVGRGQADFKRLWCGSMNIAVPTLGVIYILLGTIVLIRGAASFNSPVDIQLALPGLHMLAPSATGALRGFLSAINVGTLWGLFLNATMLTTLARVNAGIAWTFATIVLLVGAGFGALVASIFSAFMK